MSPERDEQITDAELADAVGYTILAAEKLDGTTSWWWNPISNTYQVIYEGADDDDDTSYTMSEQEYEESMEDSIFRNISFCDPEKKWEKVKEYTLEQARKRAIASRQAQNPANEETHESIPK
jgi:hypothetical protein